MIKAIATNQALAEKYACDISKDHNYAAIILYKSNYFIETRKQKLCAGETLIAEYNDGIVLRPAAAPKMPGHAVNATGDFVTWPGKNLTLLTSN